MQHPTHLLDASSQSMLQQTGATIICPPGVETGTAQHVFVNLDEFGFGCDHFPKGFDAEKDDHQYPSRLCFFHSINSKTQELRISCLETSLFCLDCLDVLVPNKVFNCWSMAKRTSLSEGGWLNTKNSEQTYPPLYEAGSEAFQSLLPQQTGLPAFPRTTIPPVSIPIPDVKDAKRAWEWLVKERKPFYIDQLHLKNGWNSIAEAKASSDSRIAKTYGTPRVLKKLKHNEVAETEDASKQGAKPIFGELASASQAAGPIKKAKKKVSATQKPLQVNEKFVNGTVSTEYSHGSINMTEKNHADKGSPSQGSALNLQSPSSMAISVIGSQKDATTINMTAMPPPPPEAPRAKSADSLTLKRNRFPKPAKLVKQHTTTGIPSNDHVTFPTSEIRATMAGATTASSLVPTIAIKRSAGTSGLELSPTSLIPMPRRQYTRNWCRSDPVLLDGFSNPMIRPKRKIDASSRHPSQSVMDSEVLKPFEQFLKSSKPGQRHTEFRERKDKSGSAKLPTLERGIPKPTIHEKPSQAREKKVASSKPVARDVHGATAPFKPLSGVNHKPTTGPTRLVEKPAHPPSVEFSPHGQVVDTRHGKPNYPGQGTSAPSTMPQSKDSHTRFRNRSAHGGTPQDKPTKPQGKSAKSRDKFTKPQNESTKPRYKSTKPRDKLTKPQGESTRPQEKPTKPQDKSTKPRDESAKPRDKLTKPQNKPTEPKEKPTKPKEKPTNPKEKPTNPKEKPTNPKEKPTKLQDKLPKPSHSNVAASSSHHHGSDNASDDETEHATGSHSESEQGDVSDHGEDYVQHGATSGDDESDSDSDRWSVPSDDDNQDSQHPSDQDDSESGQDDTEADQGDTKSDQGDTEAGQGDTESDQGDAESDQDNIESDQGDTETGQGDTESDQGDTEADQGDTEADQGDAESDQDNIESDQGDTESDHGDTESNHGDTESDQDDNESHQSDNESHQSDNESHQSDNESHQSDNESHQSDNESHQSDENLSYLEFENQSSDENSTSDDGEDDQHEVEVSTAAETDNEDDDDQSDAEDGSQFEFHGQLIDESDSENHDNEGQADSENDDEEQDEQVHDGTSGDEGAGSDGGPSSESDSDESDSNPM